MHKANPCEKMSLVLGDKQLDELDKEHEYLIESCIAKDLDITISSVYKSLAKRSLFENLKSLKLSNLGLTSLENFPRLLNLEMLDLSGNVLQVLPLNLNVEIPKLTHLNLSRNKLKTVPDYSNLELTHIDIGHNSFESLPEWILTVMKLRVFKMEFNLVAVFPSSKSHLCEQTFPSLTHLDVSHNNLLGVPLSLGRDYLLEELHVSNYYKLGPRILNSVAGNVITTIPCDLIPLLSNLHTLELSDVGLRELPDNLDSLIHLKSLNLEHNDLMWLPDNFCKLSVLQECSLSHNRFSILPEHFGKLRRLRKLCLDHNRLRNLPDSFNQLPNLTHLDLYANLVESFDFASPMFARLQFFDIWLNATELSNESDEIKSIYGTKCEALRQLTQDKERCSLPNEIVEDFEQQYSETEDSEVTEEDESSPNVYVVRCRSPIENWDEEEKPDFTSDEKDVSESLYSVELAGQQFCPADLHAPSMLPVVKANMQVQPSLENGQFEDAE